VARTPEQAGELATLRTNVGYLPGITLPDAVSVQTADAIDWREVDVACLAVPSQALPAALDSIAARIPEDLGVIMLSKGLVAPAGTAPSTLARERLGDRPIACLGGPAHAVEAVERGASLTVATPDATFAALLSSAFRKGGVACETSRDLVGVELAGVAKNAAALAAGAALADGPNGAGAAAGRVYAECFALAKASGADAESFAGPAGAGDLVATVLAPHSRNRRAGELLAQGMPRDDIRAVLGQVPEALHTAPALARAMDEAGVRSPATHELAALAEGRIEAGQWIARTRRASTRSRAA
jgi:glycerol-3-phosphate dehydrogenase (NAD(P)+)